MSERIGNGPWARLAASAIVPDEGSSSAERGRQLAEGLELTIEQGVLAATVEGCEVRVAAEPVPPRIWAAMTRYARGNPQLEAGVTGAAQSVHLEHLLLIDWEQPLVPATRALSRSCSCDTEGACEHIAALAFAFARAIDLDPSTLLTWRGCVPGAAEPEPAEPEPEAPIPAGDWEAGPLPELGPPRPLPVGAVLKRLGPSGVKVGARDLTEVLERAYESFARLRD